MSRLPRIAAVALAAATFVVACGDDNNSTSSTGSTVATTTAPTSAPTTTAAQSTTAAPATTVAASASVLVAKTSLGDVLTDASGRTLYVFTVDGPDKSNCSGGCAQTWPRYAPATATAGAGVTGTIGTIDVDGVKQVTINKQPLYYFAAESASGDTKGQGIGGNWWVVKADGTPVKS
jgi:predicted lipoprotein with Yx(FWY)xxD motif